MKRISLVKSTKRIMAGVLSVAMILTGILVVPKEAKAATATQVYFASASEYVMSDYWNGTDNKAPVKAGYVFGGWFKETEARIAGAEQDKSTNKYYAPMKEVSAADNTAVAKFVPAEVLCIKTQAALGDATSSLRILSTVDSLNYQEVGFEYKLGTNGTAQTGQNGLKKITKVYSAIKPYKDATNEELLTPSNEFVSSVSKYFIAADVSTIVKESYSKIVYARPFWVTMDGTEVMGLARNNRIVDKQNNNQYTSVGINLLPQLIAGETKTLAEIAAGKIQVTYNTTDYDVVETPDITKHATNGGTYLFPEMECHVDETAGTITFVGNAETVDTNLLADGLFANVRFEKTTTTGNAALNFAIKGDAIEFCNWLEADMKNQVVVQ